MGIFPGNNNIYHNYYNKLFNILLVKSNQKNLSKINKIIYFK